MGDFFAIFESVPDPRDINARHDLREILFIALAAMLCGAESCVEIAQFGVEKTGLLRTILELKHGPPSHDTFSRVLRVLDSVALENAFTRFMEAFRQALGPDVGQSILAVDGKSLKGAYEKGRAHMPPMMVSVWGVTMRMTFAQTEAGEGGEAEAAVKLLKSVSLKSCVVTADAIHCDRRVVETVNRSTTTSRLVASRRMIFLRSFEVIGTSKTAVIGSRTWSSTKTSQEIERKMARETLHYCAV